MSREFRLLGALLPAALVFSASASAVEFNSSYIGPNNGLYSDANNWSPNMVPNNGADTYNVFINTNLIVRLDLDPTINNLTLDSSFGRLFGTDHNLVVTGTTNLRSGNRLDVVSQLSAAVKFDLGTLADFDTATSSLDEGNYVVNAAPGTTSTLQFNGANIVTNQAGIGLVGAGASIVDQNGLDALRNFTTNERTGFIRFGAGATFTTSNDFTNYGRFVVRPGGTAIFNGSFVNSATTPSFEFGLVDVFGTDSGSSPGDGLFQLNGGFDEFSGDTLGGGGYFFVAANGAGTATVRFNGANIVNNRASLSIVGANARIVDENGNDALRNLAVNNGLLEFARHTRTTAGAFENNGQMALFGGAHLTVSGDFTNGPFSFLELTPFDVHNNFINNFGVSGFEPAPEGVLSVNLTVNGNLFLGEESLLLLSIASPTSAPLIDVNGTAVFDGFVGLTFLFGESQISNSDVLTLILTDGPISGTFADLASGERLDVFLSDTGEPSGSFLVDYSGNAFTLSDYRIVPEPSSLALSIAGGLGVCWLLRRRKFPLRFTRGRS